MIRLFDARNLQCWHNTSTIHKMYIIQESFDYINKLQSEELQQELNYIKKLNESWFAFFAT